MGKKASELATSLRQNDSDHQTLGAVAIQAFKMQAEVFRIFEFFDPLKQRLSLLAQLASQITPDQFSKRVN